MDPQGVGNVTDEGGSDKFRCQLGLALSPRPNRLGQSFQTDRVLDDLDEGLLECDTSWSPCGTGFVEADGQELRPDCGCGVVVNAIAHIWLGEAARTVVCLVEALDDSVASCAWSWFCTCFG